MLRTFALALLSLTGCSSASLCSSDVLQVARDPASDRYATVEARNCGATTDYATVVHVGRASEPQADAEEVFVADGDHGAATKGIRGAIWTNVVWTAPAKLSIAYASHARVFKRLAAVKDVAVVYRATDPIEPPSVP